MKRKINSCLCGGDIEITKRRYTYGMDGCYEDWEFNCKKCGGSWTWAADNFYGRKFYSEDDVIDIWNKIHVQEPCEDAISRQSAIDAIFDEPLYESGMKKRYAEKVIPEIFEKIKSLPPVQPKQKTGHWIDDTSLGYHVSICSNCDWRGHGDTCLIYKPNYCPNCGAKMQEVEE